MKKNLMILAVVLIGLVWDFHVNAWEGETHKALTEISVSNSQSVLDNYLKGELGIVEGLNKVLMLDKPNTPDFKRVLPKIPQNPTIMDFLKAGAYLEDVPNPRARHHFHDPYRNAGLDNNTEHPAMAKKINYWTKILYNGLSFDLTGASTLNRALGKEEPVWEQEYENYFAWPDARDYFYKALTQKAALSRNHYLALTFLSLGHIMHLLEDMGVPPHVRNDFIEAHFRVPKGLWGNPFEKHVEGEMGPAGIPSRWLTDYSPQAKVFSKLAHYFDTNTRNPNEYLGSSVPPLGTWGLSEQTNYQFLSKSTIFRENDGTLYYFPHPNADNITGYIKPGAYTWNSIPVHYSYISGYNIAHLARTKYIEKYAYAMGMTYPVPIGTVVYHTTFDKAVYEDYAKITIPRTIDYVTGLANYFFRGQLSVYRNCTSCDEIELFVTNVSSNSGIPQTLKGGTFEVYWDDARLNRHKMNDAYFSVLDSNDPYDTTEWSTNSTLAYGESIRAKIIQPPDTDVARYILVYRGSISQSPNDLDPDDPNAIAVAAFRRDNCQTCPPSNEDLEIYFENTCSSYRNRVFYRLWWRSTKGYWEGYGIVATCWPSIKISSNEPAFRSNDESVVCFPQIVNNELSCGGTGQIDVWRRYTAWKLNKSGSIIWRSDTDKSLMGYGVAVDGSGNVYVTTYNMRSKTVWKFDKYGKKLWDYNTGGNWAHGVAVDAVGNVYIAGDRSNSKSVWKLDSNGALIWNFDTGGSAEGIAVDDMNNVYVAGSRSGDKSVWKLNSNGGLIWGYDTGDSTADIAVDDVNNVYVVGDRSGAKSVWKLNSNGGLLWGYDTGSNARGVAIDSNYNVYVAGNDSAESDYKVIWKLSSSGALLWDYDTGPTIVYNYSGGHAVTVDANDNVYLAGGRTADHRSVWKFDSEGNLLWDYDTGAEYYFENGFAFDIAVDGSGNIYIVTSRLYRW